MNSNLDDSGMSLPVFSSRTNLILHNISIIPKKLLKVLTNLDSAKASGPDCIPVMVQKNCEPEFSYMLVELFTMNLKESCFADFWKVSSLVPVFKNVGERSTSKNYCPVSLLAVVSKVFEKLRVAPDRIARFFKGSRAIRALACWSFSQMQML